MHVTNKDLLPGGKEEGGTVGELRNVACHKRGLTNWRRGRGRSRLVNSETWHVTNEDSLAGGEEEGGAGWPASESGTSQMRPPFLEGRKREEGVGEIRNAERHK